MDEEPNAGSSPGELFVVFLKGVTMGAADALPGASGGTVALITGIYERLITALSSLDPGVVVLLGTIHRREGRRRLRRRLVEMDVLFLVVLAAGVVFAVVTVSRVVHVALTSYRAITFAFFFGLIASAAVVLYWQVEIESTEHVGAGLVGFTIAYMASGSAIRSSLGHSPLVVFAAGLVAISAMILPGVSGAFLLYLLGQYEFLTGTLRRFVDGLLGLASGTDPGRLLGPGIVVVSFVAGAVVGILTIARIIRRALAAYRTATLIFLVSLMTGALRGPIIEVAESVDVWTPAKAGGVLVAALVGGVAVLALERYTDDLEY